MNKVRRIKKIIVCIILVIILYLLLPLEAGIRHKVPQNSIDNIRIHRTFYSPTKNRMESEEKVMKDIDDIKQLISYIKGINCSTSIRTITNPYGFSATGSSVYRIIFCDEINSPVLTIYISNKHIKISNITYKCFNHLEYFDDLF